MEDVTQAEDELTVGIDIIEERLADPKVKDHPSRVSSLYILSSLLDARSKQTGSMDDLDRAIEAAGLVVDSTPQDHPDRDDRLWNLSFVLHGRFKKIGSIEDINRAIEVMDMILDSIPKDHPARVDWCNDLANQLGRRFKKTGSIEDINRAIKVMDAVVDSIPEDYTDRCILISNLGTHLGIRFEQTESMDDLNRAIKVLDMLVASTPEDNSDRATWLNNLGSRLGSRFKRTGSIDDLNRAIKITETAVDSAPKDNPYRDSWLNNLGNWLGSRFKRTGSMDDLNHAIEVADMAVNSTPKDHLDRAEWLNTLSLLLGNRSQRTGSIDDLNRAVEAMEIAVDSMPEDYPRNPDYKNRAMLLNTLSVTLGIRFEKTGVMADLYRAIEVADIAVNSTPEHYPHQAAHLNNLGVQLSWRFEHTRSMDDINRAIQVTELAMNCTPKDHPDRASLLTNLGIWLTLRSEQTESTDDLVRAVSVYKEGRNFRNASPSIRAGLALYAARILASEFNWEESSQLLREAVELLPTVSPRSLKHTDKQSMLAAFPGLASMAAAAALNAGEAPDKALQLLELGRGVIAGLLLELRGDISDLKQQHPDLAGEFVSLRDVLDLPVDRNGILRSTDTSLSWESQASRSRDADQKLSETLAKIRNLPGFHNFLLPPTPDELMAAADPDPIVVINLSSYRCDAFIVQQTEIRILELPNLTLQEVKERTQGQPSFSLASSSSTSSLLEWLWDAVSRPVLEALGFNNPPSDGNWPRVWWIPTGMLSQLPLHAAGYHTRRSSETVLDRVMSSYASSIKSLILGRRHHIRQPAVPSSDHALLLAMRETPGLPTSGALPYAEIEVNMLNDLCPSLRLRSIQTQCRKEEVLKHLRGCKIFHFAGHGHSNPTEPSKSCLLLEDWATDPLTVDDLREYSSKRTRHFSAISQLAPLAPTRRIV